MLSNYLKKEYIADRVKYANGMDIYRRKRSIIINRRIDNEKIAKFGYKESDLSSWVCFTGNQFFINNKQEICSIRRLYSSPVNRKLFFIHPHIQKQILKYSL